MPWSLAASMSTMSTPTPWRAITRREGSVSMRGGSIRANCTMSACAPAVAVSSPERRGAAVIRSIPSPGTGEDLRFDVVVRLREIRPDYPVSLHVTPFAAGRRQALTANWRTTRMIHHILTQAGALMHTDSSGLFDLTGRRAVVTGGAGALGSQAALALASARAQGAGGGVDATRGAPAGAGF